MRSTTMVEITDYEAGLLALIRREPQLVENLRRCTAGQDHERSMLERLRKQLVLAVGAQIKAARQRG